MEDPPKKFFRLSPGREVRLRYAYIVKCTGVVKDAAGNVTGFRPLSGDYNADGNTDLLWYNPFSGKIVFWHMDFNAVRITGFFANPSNAGNNNWKVLAGGDYGVGPGGIGDSNDLVWRNASSGNFVVWYMDTAGNRTFGTFTIPSGPPNMPPAFGPADQAMDQPMAPIDWFIVGPR